MVRRRFHRENNFRHKRIKAIEALENSKKFANLENIPEEKVFTLNLTKQRKKEEDPEDLREQKIQDGERLTYEDYPDRKYLPAQKLIKKLARKHARI